MKAKGKEKKMHCLISHNTIELVKCTCAWGRWRKTWFSPPPVLLGIRQQHFHEIGSQFYFFFPDKISCNTQIAVPEMDTRRRRGQACQLVGENPNVRNMGERWSKLEWIQIQGAEAFGWIIKLLHKSVLLPPVTYRQWLAVNCQPRPAWKSFYDDSLSLM